MEARVSPRAYEEWRTSPQARAEDAAYLFGYFLIKHCRDEALASLPDGLPDEAKAAVEQAVDIGLHNVCDLLEGFWPLEAGSGHEVSLALLVEVRNVKQQIIETQQISPCKLDLPIGYWKWAKDREFR